MVRGAPCDGTKTDAERRAELVELLREAAAAFDQALLDDLLAEVRGRNRDR